MALTSYDCGPETIDGAGYAGASNIEATAVVVERGGRRVLDGVSLWVAPGQVLAVVGPSGGGKSTLLAALAGTVPVESGSIAVGGCGRIGVVPQDDIIHLELPLRRTLVHAARLRLAGTAVDVRVIVDAVLDELDLSEHAAVRVGDLSGGQRKRASIAVELMARPGLLLLDEPTAGLDPATAAALMRTLRRLADGGCTVVLTTHQLTDVASADAVAVLDGGRVAQVGDPAAVLAFLSVAGDEKPRPSALPAMHPERLDGAPRQGPTAWDQWWALTRRNAEVLARGRLTLAILLGAPLLVVAMFAVLFRPGTFDAAGAADPAARATVAYWLAFAGFFFGLTYGLLQVCTEVPLARRERFSGVGIGAYVAAKAAVLVPLLFAVNLALVVVLRALDRLPGDDLSGTTALLGVLLLDAIAALALGLLLSTLVGDTAQAAMALPMVCFPAVLFAGVIVPVDEMAAAGRVISIVTPARWAFEAVAASLDVDASGGQSSALVGAFALAGCTVVLVMALLPALRRRL